MLEISVASLTAKGKGKREKMALIVGLLIFVVGVPSALSFGILSDLKIFGKTVFDLADYAVSNVLMPLGVLLVSIFVPLKMKKDVLMKELGVSKNKGYKLFVLWLFLLRFIATNCDNYRILKCTWHYLNKGSVSLYDTLPFLLCSFCSSFTVTN